MVKEKTFRNPPNVFFILNVFTVKLTEMAFIHIEFCTKSLEIKMAQCK